MNAPKNILCALDFERDSDALILEADAWARRYSAKLAIVYAIREPQRSNVLFPQIGQSSLDVLPQITRVASDNVAARVQKVASRSGDSLDVRVDVGAPETVILSVAREISADLIIVGGGARGPNSAIGSIPLAIARHSSSPVLIFDEASENGGPILVATDLSDPSYPAISAGAFLSASTRKPLSVLHVWGAPETAVPFPDASGLGPSYTLEAMSETQARELHDAADRELSRAMSAIACSGLRLVEQGSPTARVVALAQRTHPSLLVIGTHGRTGLRRVLLGSTAEEILKNLACSVLVVRLKSQGDQDEEPERNAHEHSQLSDHRSMPRH